MIKLYVTELKQCYDCPSHRYHSGTMVDSFCGITHKDITDEARNSPPYFPLWCPLTTKQELSSDE